MIQSVQRAIAIVDAVAHHGDWIGVRDIARKVGLKVPTVQQLLKTLEAESYLEFSQEFRKYRIGLRVLLLGCSISIVEKMREFCRPYINEIFNKYHETLAVLTFVNGATLVVDWRESSHDLTVAAPKHQIINNPHIMASGQVLLAYQSKEFLTMYAKNETFKNDGPNLPKNENEFFANLANVKKEKISITDNAINSGVIAIGLPVFDSSGKLVMALGTSVPKFRMTDKLKKELIDELKECCQTLSQKLTSSPVVF